MKQKTSYGRIKISIIGGFIVPGKKGMKRYPLSIKEQAVRMHLEEGFTKKDVAQKLGISDPQRIKKWSAVYRKYGVIELPSKPKGRPRKHKRSTQEQTELELKRLRMENELLRNFLYETSRR
jgi:transposase-like protein